MTTADMATLERVCEQTLAPLGYELVAVELQREPSGLVLRVFFDTTSGAGVSLEDCTRASRDLSAALDVASLIDQHYSLEVSSPGLARPLVKEKDFQRFAGRRARVRVRSPIGGQRNFAGTLRGAEGGRIAIECEGRLVELPLADVAKANLEVEL